MKIILNQDVVHLGEEGDVVEVKDGYARNYLLPTKTAVVYNKANEALFKSRAAAIEQRKKEKRAASASLKEKLDNLTLTITVPAGESGKLFGSVTSQIVQTELQKLGFEIERKKIDVATHAIKMTGTYSVTIHLYENEYSIVKLIVQSEAEKIAAEKKAQEEAAAAAAAEAEARAAAEKEAAEAASAEEAVAEESVAEASEAEASSEEA